jgi:hypothetical protein
MGDKLPIRDFIKRHVSGLSYSLGQYIRLGQGIYKAAMGNTFRAAKEAGYDVDSSFVPLFYEAIGVEIPE